MFVCNVGVTPSTQLVLLQISKVTHTKLRQDWRLVTMSMALVKSCSRMHIRVCS